MIHPRSDYNCIQDMTCGTSIKDNEPVFILRAQDKLAPETLMFWAAKLKESGGDIHTANNIIKWAEKMRIWQLQNGAKVPDTPPDCLSA